MQTTAYLEIRRQHSVGSSNGRFGGPDTYVTVQIVPEGVAKLTQLKRSVAEKRGIELVHFGEGYSKHRGSRSALGRAILAAEEFVEAHDAKLCMGMITFGTEESLS